MSEPILIIDSLKKYFPLKKDFFWAKQEWLKANEDISFSVNEGECIGIVGESGCGKSTLGKTLMNLYPKTAGEVYIKNPKYVANNAKVSSLNEDLSIEKLLSIGLKNEDFYHSINNDFLVSYLGIYKFKDSKKKYKQLEEEKQNSFQQLLSSLSNPKYYPIHHIKGKKLREVRALIQMIFQDPLGSLNPAFNIEKILQEAFIIAKEKVDKETLIKLINKVGLDKQSLDKYPHEFSGGQQQRIGIARALSRQPKIIVCDEPVSALDVSIQAQILNLLVRFQKELKLTLLLISHNLSVVKFIADKIIVMYLGKIVEIADVEEIYNSPKHPYTESLLKAIPTLEIGKKYDDILQGEINLDTPDIGCSFYTRCPYAQDKCQQETPNLVNNVACHYPLYTD